MYRFRRQKSTRINAIVKPGGVEKTWSVSLKMAFDYIRRQTAAVSWINESYGSLVNRAHCEHSESMTYLCRLAVWFLYNKKWAVEAEDYVHEGKYTEEEAHPRFCSDCLSVLSQGIRKGLGFTLVWKGYKTVYRYFQANFKLCCIHNTTCVL